MRKFITIPVSVLLLLTSVSAELPDKAEKLKQAYSAAITRATEPLKATYKKELLKLKDEYIRTSKLTEALAIEEEIKSLDGDSVENAASQRPDATNVEPILFIASGKKYYFVGKVISQDDAISYGVTKGWSLATFRSAREAKALLKAFEELGDRKLPDHHFGHVRTGMGFSKSSDFTIGEQPITTDAKEKAELLSLMTDVYRNPEYRSGFTEVTVHYRTGGEKGSRNPTLFRRDSANNNGQEVNPTVLGCIYEEVQK